ncbi:hypothetical protein CHS0354_014287, partial [Potamilus streckersoni]
MCERQIPFTEVQEAVNISQEEVGVANSSSRKRTIYKGWLAGKVEFCVGEHGWAWVGPWRGGLGRSAFGSGW